MTVSTSPPHRGLRAVVAAFVAMIAGGGAHLLAGGVVSIPGVAAGLAVLLGPAWSLAGRERGWAVIAGLQLAGQQVVHLLLELASDRPGQGTGLPEDVTLYGHIAAAALIAAWLRYGERRTWNAAHRAARAVAARWRWLLSLFDRCEPPYPVHPIAAPDRSRVATGRPLRHVVVRRGPPLPA
jgi:hypothetical protein